MDDEKSREEQKKTKRKEQRRNKRIKRKKNRGDDIVSSVGHQNQVLENGHPEEDEIDEEDVKGISISIVPCSLFRNTGLKLCSTFHSYQTTKNYIFLNLQYL